MNELTARQQLFVKEYLVDLCATRAAIRAGYSEHTANEQGSQILAKLNIQTAIAEAAAERDRRVEIDQDFVLLELFGLANQDVAAIFDENGALFDVHSMPVAARRAIASLEVVETYTGEGDARRLTGYLRKVKFWDKSKALHLLAQHKALLGATTHRHEIVTEPTVALDDISLVHRINAVYDAVARRKAAAEADCSDLA
jgi:phage terminase small subunit